MTVTSGSVDVATWTQAAPYDANDLTYDGSGRGTSDAEAGRGNSTTSGGLGAYTVACATNTNAPSVNNWATRMTESLADGNTQGTYANAYGAPLLKAVTPAGAGCMDVDYYRYSAAD